MPDVKLMLGDCLEAMRGLPSESVDAVVTDPPAGIGFMGLEFDRDHGGRSNWIAWHAERLAECLRLAKPGSRLLCWSIPRTSHWTGIAVEDAGWVVEDQVSHLFGQGFPKHGSKLKPAREDWWLARKPGGKVPVLPGLDACRIAGTPEPTRFDPVKHAHDGYRMTATGAEVAANAHPSGRWPANVVLSCCGEEPHLDGCPVAELDRQSGTLKSGKLLPHHADHGKSSGCLGAFSGTVGRESYGDSGGASRFFYCPKASRSDRGQDNTHPTVKSLALMRWLCRLITPPGGAVLDPFAGSGSTALAAEAEGFGFVGVELSPEYHAIASGRIAAARAATPLFRDSA